jgi:putative DNA primase/helicase
LYNGIPKELIKNAKFCCWRYEERDGKRTKVPFNPRTGGKAMPNNPDTFAPFETVEAIQIGYDGIGVGVFGDLCAIDIDHCVEEGEISELAGDIISTMRAYTEFSPSGNGIRILFKASGFEYDKAKFYINNQQLGLEVYVSGATNKFVTVTGNIVCDGEYAERGEELRIVLEKYMKRPEKPGKTVSESTKALDCSDAELINKAQTASNGELFKGLWSGQITGYSSQSEADLALCNLLAFWTGRDAIRMDRLFRQSGLMRDKWDRPQSGATYGAITIQAAINGCTETYSPVKGVRTSTQTDTGIHSRTLADIQPNKNKRYAQSDLGNGYLFADWFKDTVRYVPERKMWFIYDGKIWQPDNGNLSVMELCKQLADSLLLYALSIQDEQDKQAYIKFVNKWQGHNYRDTILKEAASVHPVSINEFDKDPYLFNCTNGTLDLRTGEFKAHNPVDMLSKISGVEYNPAARSERWERFIAEVMQNDNEKARFLQKALGYALTGDTRYECFFILYGATSRNGKGTCMETFMRLMGDYGRTMRPESIGMKQNSNGSGPSEDIARLAGARFVNVPEPDKRLVLSTALVKTLTGNDSITARYLHENSFEYRGQFKIFINTNYLPTVNDQTIFSSGRVKLVPFERHFDEAEQDRGLKDELSTDGNLSGILNWCIEGLQMVGAYGFDMPDSVRKATEEYERQSDKVAQFIDEEMVRDFRGEIKPGDAYQRYRQWCTDNGFHTDSSKSFRAALCRYITIKPARPKTFKGWPTQLILGYRWREPNERLIEVIDPDCPFDVEGA